MKKIYFPLLLLTTAFSSYGQEKIEPQYNTDTFETQALEYTNARQMEQAIATYTKIDITDPSYLNAQSQILLLLLKLDKKEEAEALCKQLIHQYGDETPSLVFLNYATMKSDQGDYEQALIYLERAKKENSLNVLPKFNEAIVHYRAGQKQKALDLLKDIITVAPTYAKAYYILGLIAIEDGNGSVGLLSLLTYLSMHPSNEEAEQCLHQLNRNLSEVYATPPQLKYSDEGDDFSELDIILKNNLAQHKNYPLKVTLDHRVSRVIQALLEYMNEHKVENGFFENRFSPWMKAVVTNNLLTPFTYTTMRLYEKSYPKDFKKNTATITRYVNHDYNTYISPNLNQAMVDGKKYEVSTLEKGFFYFQGKENNLNGAAMELNYNFDKLSEGYFKNGKLEQELKRYTTEGVLATKTDYKDDQINGIVTTYFSTGNVYSTESAKNNVLDGPTIIYFNTGKQKGTVNYQNDTLVGRVHYVFTNGQTEYDYQLTDGKKNGELVVYNEKGAPVSKYTYKDDQLDGLCITYNLDGSILSEALYKEDEYEYYKDYYNNGQLSYWYKYENSKLKESESYNLVGDLIERKNFNTEGELIESISYSKDKIYLIEKFKDQKIVGRQTINPTTLQLEEVSVKGHGVVYYPDGVVQAEGQTIQGLREGTWKYYYTNGVLFNEVDFVQGYMNGAYKKYTIHGQLEESYSMKDHMMEGLYCYYLHGKLRYTGYYKEDELDGPVTYYYDYPTPEIKKFYSNGTQEGKTYYYLQDGSPFRVEYHERGVPLYIDYINKGETTRLALNTYSELGTFTANQLNSKATYTLNNGIFNGPVKRTDSTGKVTLDTYTYINDYYDGAVKSYYINGALNDQSNFILGKQYGIMDNYNPDGKLRLQSTIIKGDLSGLRTLFYPEGKAAIRSSFVSDLRQGEEVLYNSQGVAVMALYYDFDLLVGYKKMTESEILGELIPITAQDVLVESNYKSGVTAARVNIRKQSLHGDLHIFNNTAQPIYSQTFDTNQRNGLETMAYANGAIYTQTNYQKGKLHGIKEIYNPTGQKLFTLNYSLSELHGPFQIFENNVLKQTFFYDSDLLSQQK